MNNKKLSLISTLRQNRKLSNAFLVTISILLIFAMLVYFSSRQYENSRRATIEIGDELVNALETYYNDKQKYPNSLDDLVPHYLDIVQEPKWGDSGWEYDGGPESLKVGYKTKHGGLYPQMVYTKQGWVYDS